MRNYSRRGGRSKRSNVSYQKNKKGQNKVFNPAQTQFDSNGPTGRIKGTAMQIVDKYTSLAREARLGGNELMEENLLQYSEYYATLITEHTIVMKALEIEEAKQSENEVKPQDTALDNNNTALDNNSNNHKNKNSSTKEKTTEQKPTEQKTMEQKPTEQKTMEQKPTEQKTIEPKPVEQNLLKNKKTTKKQQDNKNTDGLKNIEIDFSK